METEGLAVWFNLVKRLCLVLLAMNFSAYQAAAADIARMSTLQEESFKREAASADTRHIAAWVAHSADNGGMPFIIVDKVQAKVFAFDARGRFRGAAPALLGMARGDDAVPGIGNRALSEIRPEERTTPAGRFVASLDRNLKGEEILWVDYESAVSMHRVVRGKPDERRAQRLASATPLDNRISYGCINIPVKFYENVVSSLFSGTSGIVYVLPEIRSVKEVFALYEVEAQVLAQVQSQSQSKSD